MTRPALLRRLSHLDTVPATTAAAAGISGALLIVFVANYHVPKGENGGTGPGIMTGLGCLALAGLLFGVLLPWLRTREPARQQRATVVLGVLAVLSVAAFWSGATPVLAAATIAASTGSPSARRVQITRLVAGAGALAAIIAALASSHLT
ncbi:MAG: hypothetical protein EPN43_05155 [Jatrophihabitans sp.]|nr:MAG: hypothetical protein EPN43_05155 [Jatrophihabitans sp.]